MIISLFRKGEVFMPGKVRVIPANTMEMKSSKKSKVQKVRK